MNRNKRNTLLHTALAFALTASLAACGKEDKFAAEPAAEPAPGAAAAAAAPEAAAPARADVQAQAQFAVSQLSEANVLAMKETATCSLENVINVADNSLNPGPMPNTYLAAKGVHYKLIGFATNQEKKSVPASIQLVLVGPKVYSLATTTGSERPDVGTYFKNPVFATAGYQADAAFDDVDAGEYRVFAIEGDGNEQFACPTHQLLTVR